MTSPSLTGPQDISKDVIEALKGALTDATLVEEEGGFCVSTVGAPHVTGCATAREPGGANVALDLKGALRAVPVSSSAKGKEEKGAYDSETEIDGAFHVARIVSDAEFEGGIGPLNVEVALDKAKKSTDAAIERAKGEVARRVLEAVQSSVVEASESPRKGGEEEKEKEEEEEEEKVGGEAA